MCDRPYKCADCMDVTTCVEVEPEAAEAEALRAQLSPLGKAEQALLNAMKLLGTSFFENWARAHDDAHLAARRMLMDGADPVDILMFFDWAYRAGVDQESARRPPSHTTDDPAPYSAIGATDPPTAAPVPAPQEPSVHRLFRRSSGILVYVLNEDHYMMYHPNRLAWLLFAGHPSGPLQRAGNDAFTEHVAALRARLEDLVP